MLFRSRPLVGHQLLELALSRAETTDWARDPQEGMPEMVIHAGDPVRVGAINVGFRGLAASSAGIVQLLQQTCCDVLFLSDLRTTRGKIGRPRRTIEAAVRDEWRLWTDIPTVEGRPVGMGALIHASLASHIEQISPNRPADVPEPQWIEAVAGRILQIGRAHV